jgi:hypothetical protein
MSSAGLQTGNDAIDQLPGLYTADGITAGQA